MITTWIIHQSFLKYAFSYSFAISSASILEQSIPQGGDFFTNILNGIPSQFIMILGVIYGIALVGRQVSTLIKQIKMDSLAVHQAKEKLNQEKIETAEKQKELDK